MIQRWLITGSHGYIGTALRQTAVGIGVQAETCDLKLGQDYRQLRGQHYDVVLHLAAYVSVIESMQNEQKYFENNAHGVADFLEKNNVEKMVFVSTGGAMYGNKRQAREEDANWNTCTSPYAQSKYLGEKFVREHWPNHVILRLANVFGGDYSVRGEAAVHAHFQADNPIVVYGGEQTRDFIHVKQVVRSILWAALVPLVGTFNIGSGVEERIIDIAERYSLARRVPIVRAPARDGEVDFVSLDISHAQAVGLL